MAIPQTDVASSGRTKGVTTPVLSAPVMAFDLAEETERVQTESAWQAQGHSARTLLKDDALRLVLIAIKKGAQIDSHRVDHRVMLQATAGRVQVYLPTRVVDLPSGHIVALERNMPYSVRALADSAYLMTIMWSD